MRSVESHLAPLGSDEPNPQPLSGNERVEILDLAGQLAQPAINDEFRLEIAFRMKQVLTGAFMLGQEMEVREHPPP